MSARRREGRSHRVRVAGALVVLAIIACSLRPLYAGFARMGAVGGIYVNAQGLLTAPAEEDRRDLRQQLEKALKPIGSDIEAFSKLRKVSLRGLEEAIAKHRESEVVPLPQEVQLLAGLQQIKYVFVYPEFNDVVIAGPAEGWKVNDQGDLVGKTTGRSVMMLDDLLVALRFAKAGAIQCSIDPTKEGLAKVRTLAAGLRSGSNPQVVMEQIEQALGPQMISVGGVPDTSHFARVMVSADFHMKRLAMNFERPPVADMPSYLHLTKADRPGLQNMLPRWWLAPKAKPLGVAADGMAWELRGLGVECKTEEDFLNQDGSRARTGKSGSAAQKWADTFTAKYDAVAAKHTIFAQLRNLMDLAVVGALIEKEGLFDKAGLKAPHLTTDEPLDAYVVPKAVASQASVVQKSKGLLISASGGVQLYPEQLVEKAEQSEELPGVRKAAAATSMRWWWD